MKRFNIIVLNYKRIASFFNNFYKIQNFDTVSDAITIVSCSPSEEEALLISEFELKKGIRINYITRRNWGMAEMARIELLSGYFIKSNIYDFDYFFQFQEHYLDTESSFSR